MTSPKPLALSIKLLVLDDQGRVLVLKRSMSSRSNPGKWDLPGGKADPNETIDQSARREVLEETGLDITIGRVVGAAESESPNNRIAYLILEAHAAPGEVRLSNEHDDFAWLHPKELPDIDLVRQFRSVAEAYGPKD